MKTNHPKPLIGIMTTRKADGSIAGNGLLFKALQKKLISQDGISFVFTPEDANSDYITGYAFLPEQNHWIKEKFRYPDLVYNRIPFRKSEQSDQCQQFLSLLKEKNIPFFNPCFIDKYELYEVLKNHPFLETFLPQTILIHGKKDLFKFQTKHKSIYLKPAQSSKGKGIFRLKIIGDSTLQFDGIDHQETYKSFDHFWGEWGKELLEKKYLAQEEVKSVQYKGSRFDFRILAHANDSGYIVTGIGIRQSQGQEITTHIPSGGRFLPYELLQSKEHDRFIESIVPEIGKSLSDRFGYFGEFSIDAGVSITGQYYIYEVNSKPMSFDEIVIEAKKIEQLCSLFLQLTDYEN
ncbi:YheC/YheD family protein [Bacillus sp. sid0103]|uniref:YheC/YheD family endospore coat-associated protein n=1 Tax=Bacillus sp. sid0103 TaxID=2856337 RepID=UPI001C459429|nr:YheC/YheD family protein [Bacillus sp. sid0103]MBV7508170.1 YheC/YheD family protein [Bacillus sp. sid0103]